MIINKIYRRLLRLYAWVIFRKKVHVFGIFKVGANRKITIGKNCRINSGVFILGQDDVRIGDNVILSANCMIIDSGLDLNIYFSGKSKPHFKSFVYIEDDVWVGAGAIILPGVRVGHHSVVAAGSIVTRDVAPYSLVAGNPAKTIKKYSN